MEYARLRGEAGSDVSLVDLGFQTDLRVYLHLRQTWMAFSESQLPIPAPSEAWEGVESPGS